MKLCSHSFGYRDYNKKYFSIFHNKTLIISFFLFLVFYSCFFSSLLVWAESKTPKANACYRVISSFVQSYRSIDGRFLKVKQNWLYWQHYKIGWFKTFNIETFDQSRHDYLEYFQLYYPNQSCFQSGSSLSSFYSTPILPTPHKVEEKLAFLEAVGVHFISSDLKNPLRLENILDSRLRDFFKKRQFFQKIKNMQFEKIKMNDLEEILLDIYTLNNQKYSSLPSKIAAIVSLLRPFQTKESHYDGWYREAVIQRFYLETLRIGLASAFQELNIINSNSLFSKNRYQMKIFKNIGYLFSSFALNWYVFLPMADTLGFVHLPEFQTLDWINVDKLIAQQYMRNPRFLHDLISTEFQHETVDAVMRRYGLSQGGALAKSDLLYGTLRSLYLGFVVPPAIYLFIAQFGLFDFSSLDHFMVKWMELRDQLLPWLFQSHALSTEKFDSLVKPDEW